MHYRELGTSGIEVSEVGFGAWVIETDWWGDRSDEGSIEMLHHAIEQGTGLLDTGDVYGHGHSEEVTGGALADCRDETTVATKIGYDFYSNLQVGHGEFPREITGEWVREAIEKSFERLDMEYADLLQLHNANVNEVMSDVLEALDEPEKKGLIKATGWAFGPPIGWLAEGDVVIEEEFNALQVVWNALERDVGNHFLDTIREIGSSMSLTAHVPHSSGLLNGQVRLETELGSDDHRGFHPDERYETSWERLEQLRFPERDGERTMAQAPIVYLLGYDETVAITPTFRMRADIDEWAKALDVPKLTDREMTRVEELYADNFGVDRFNGMDALRLSVDGDDIRATDLDKRVAKGAYNEA